MDPAQTRAASSASCCARARQVTPDSVILELSNPELTQTVQRGAARLPVGAGGVREPQGGAPERAPQPGSRHRQHRGALQTGRARPGSERDAVQGRADLRIDAETEARRDRGAEEPPRRRPATAGDHSAGHQVPARAAGSGRQSAEGGVGAAAEAARGSEGQGRHGRRAPVRLQQSDDAARARNVGRPGSNLARVANPINLKAELRIAETQTKDIRIGQYAEVDTRNGIVKGPRHTHGPGVARAARSVST